MNFAVKLEDLKKQSIDGYPNEIDSALVKLKSQKYGQMSMNDWDILIKFAQLERLDYICETWC